MMNRKKLEKEKLIYEGITRAVSYRYTCFTARGFSFRQKRPLRTKVRTTSIGGSLNFGPAFTALTRLGPTPVISCSKHGLVPPFLLISRGLLPVSLARLGPTVFCEIASHLPGYH
jgi:hypothetical protein